MTDIDKANEYIKNAMQNLELTFLGIEDKRLNEVKFPFYDGGLTPMILFYKRKYNFPFKAPKYISDIQGNSLLEICNNFYANYNFKPNLDYEPDLFDDVNKDYYFQKKTHDFDLVITKFKNLYQSQTSDALYVLDWVIYLPNVLLSSIAINEKPNLGLDNNDVQIKLFNYNNYLIPFIEKNIQETPTRLTYNYLSIFCFYQIFCKMINRNSNIVKSIGGELILQLFKLIKPNKLIIFPSVTEKTNYLLNWLSYFIIKDYLEIYKDYFFKTYDLKTIAMSIVLKEGFENSSNKIKNNLTNNIKNENMRRHKGHRKNSNNSNNNRNKKNQHDNIDNIPEGTYTEDLEHFNGSKEETIKETIKDTKKIVKPMWKMLLHWMIFGIFLYIACRGIIFFWSIVYNFFANK
jgi:hypothetical protein